MIFRSNESILLPMSTASTVIESTMRRRLSVGSWVLYDFSDTIFSASILTFYFPLWVTEDSKGSDALFAVALSGSMMLVVLTAPLLGTVSDQMNRRIPFLAFSVVSCAICTALIGVFGGLSTGIVLFIIANYLYQTGLVFYNSLMVNVSSEKNRGIISGIGIGAGYIGLIVAFLAFAPFVDAQGNQAAFLPTAVLYVLFALPLLLLLKERGVRREVNLRLVKDSYRQLYTTFQRARHHANFFRFLISRFMYMEGINTVTSFFVIYLVEVGDFEESEARTMIIMAVLIATIASWITGFLVSRVGPKKVLMIGLSAWSGLVLVSVIADMAWTFWAIAGVMGLFWATPQIADRVLLTRLAPHGQVGEFFGLFQMSGRLSAVMGPALWGLTTWGLMSLGEMRYRVAVLIIAVFIIGGLIILWTVKDRREESDIDSDDAYASFTPSHPSV